MSIWSGNNSFKKSRYLSMSFPKADTCLLSINPRLELVGILFHARPQIKSRAVVFHGVEWQRKRSEILNSEKDLARDLSFTTILCFFSGIEDRQSGFRNPGRRDLLFSPSFLLSCSRVMNSRDSFLNNLWRCQKILHNRPRKNVMSRFNGPVTSRIYSSQSGLVYFQTTPDFRARSFSLLEE